ncbi:hypothetical protein CBR_g38668 [Chara braunii]|uniref:Mannosyltransferase n=1 Tax=Chara braunii TaxID=69332 RepID=A0A388K0N6_CHABU|nr:hypothetical protein CBR_g38668 [Chara braunii]|eukprot:GBG63602.1 hypothetical protein CBR_g38668 [Chara braunii]
MMAKLTQPRRRKAPPSVSPSTESDVVPLSQSDGDSKAVVNTGYLRFDPGNDGDDAKESESSEAYHHRPKSAPSNDDDAQYQPYDGQSRTTRGGSRPKSPSREERRQDGGQRTPVGQRTPAGRSSPPGWRTSPGDDLAFPWHWAFFALAVARSVSACLNLIHDCDETFNYWEPLHFLDHGTGLQTWEYSARYALRSYLYLVFHLLLIKPLSWCASWWGGGMKVVSFYWLRLVFGLVSAATEASLVTSLSSILGRKVGMHSLILLVFSSAMFVSSTAFLPSTFTMYFMSASVAAMWMKRPHMSVTLAAVGVLVGWPFAVLAFVPVVLHALLSGGFVSVVGCGLGVTASVMTISALVDRYFYGRWTVSVLNLVLYNVAGGGDSHLYGVEGPFYYLRNCANNFNVALPLALLLPFFALLFKRRWMSSLSLVLVGVSPVYVWMTFMSTVAHKEERFMYVIYPLVCTAAAVSLNVLCTHDVDASRRLTSFHAESRASTTAYPFFSAVMSGVRRLTLLLFVILSLSRITALLHNYSAPMKIYSALPSLAAHPGVEEPPPPWSPVNGWPGISARRKDLGGVDSVVLCVGSEWYRYPSSYFLPSVNYSIGFLDDGFRGLLPFPFGIGGGGTASAPEHFNNRNKAAVGQFVSGEAECDYVVELVVNGSRSRVGRSSNKSTWQVIAEIPFVDAQRSHPLFRAFFIPGISERRNVYGTYRLAQKRRKRQNHWKTKKPLT